MRTTAEWRHFWEINRGNFLPDVSANIDIMIDDMEKLEAKIMQLEKGYSMNEEELGSGEGEGVTLMNIPASVLSKHFANTPPPVEVSFRFALGQQVRWHESVQIWKIVLRRYDQPLHMNAYVEYGLRPIALAGIAPAMACDYAYEDDLSPVEDTL